MTSTPTNIAYAVGRLSMYTSNPSTQHWQAIHRVFKYLKGTMDYGLCYLGYPSVLEGYFDASWITHVVDDHSILQKLVGYSYLGMCYLLGFQEADLYYELDNGIRVCCVSCSWLRG